MHHFGSMIPERVGAPITLIAFTILAPRTTPAEGET